MLVWLVASALAAPVLGVHATGGVGQQASEVEPWKGGGLTVFAPVKPRVAVGVRAEVGYIDRFALAALPQVRVQPILTDGPTLELVAGAGVLSHRSLFPAASLGAGATIPLGSAPVRLRAEGTWITTPGEGPTRFLLSLGLESSKREAPVVVPVEPDPPLVVEGPPLDLFDDDEVADPSASLELLTLGNSNDPQPPQDLQPPQPPQDPQPPLDSQDPPLPRTSEDDESPNTGAETSRPGPPPVAAAVEGESMVTIAWPECQTVPASQASQILAGAPADQRVLVKVGDGLPVLGAASELATSLPEPVDQGSLLVVAWPGDTVTVANHTVAVASDGFAVVQLPEDAHEVTVLGGGRSHTVDVAIAAQHGTWVRAPQPTPVRFGFEVNRAELTQSDSRELAHFAESAGSWSFTVQGGYSPEGSLDRNLDLAKRRAQAAVDVLLAAGIPTSRIQVLDPSPPDPALSATLQRKTVVTPVQEVP